MSPPYTEVRFTLPYSLPFEGEFDFDWAGDSFSVKIENKQVFDERSEAVTGLGPKKKHLSRSSIKIPLYSVPSPAQSRVQSRLVPSAL
jgi:hypothetical protein